MEICRILLSGTIKDFNGFSSFFLSSPFKTPRTICFISSQSHLFIINKSVVQHFIQMGFANIDSSQFHVLAVDDSIIDRKLIERLLKTSSYHVTAVDSVSKALQFLGLLEEEQLNMPSAVTLDNHNQVIQVNLIITDYCMPGMTGYDLLRKIKESTSFKDVPVVIMSSENVPSRINMCLEEGAEEFFLKPVQLSDVNKLRPHLLKGRAKEEERRSNNKRKGDEEILPSSPDKTRTKF